MNVEGWIVVGDVSPEKGLYGGESMDKGGGCMETGLHG